MYQKPQPSKLSSFPESKADCEGIEVMEADFQNRSCYITFDIPYGGQDGRMLTFHLLTPSRTEEEEEGGKQFPLILYVKGSAWRKQDMGGEIAQLSRFCKRGYVVAMPEYRPSDEAAFPGQIEDIKLAAEFLYRHAEEYGADREKMAIWGDSSGGHTALMTAFTWENSLFQWKAVVDYYGPTDISRMNEEPSTQDHLGADSPEGMLIGGVPVAEHPEKYEPTIVMRQISPEKAIPPVLIIHGSRDRLVPFQQSVLLFERLKACQKEARLVKLRLADHGGPAFWTEEVLELVEEFLQSAFEKNLD